MRNTSIYTSNGLNVMNSINVETNTIPTINADLHRNECQQMGLPVATKSQPKPKTNKCIDSCSRPTKRPPSERRFKCDQCERTTNFWFDCILSNLLWVWKQECSSLVRMWSVIWSSTRVSVTSPVLIVRNGSVEKTIWYDTQRRATIATPGLPLQSKQWPRPQIRRSQMECRLWFSPKTTAFRLFLWFLQWANRWLRITANSPLVIRLIVKTAITRLWFCYPTLTTIHSTVITNPMLTTSALII